ncbi:MAG: FmdE family protein [Candidatus Methanoperedens sp.]|nr:FmdE family protein [Candidatus Methanoperedens sp.]
MDKKTVNLAIELHGHLAPGIALGLRMSELALSRLNAKKGDKHLIGISETARCLADAMQAATGCTLGHGNACVEDYGKLAITIGDVRTKKGVRVALKDAQLLTLDSSYFLIQNVEIKKNQSFEKSDIVRCTKCNELIPQSLLITGKDYCKACGDRSYYEL